MAILLEKEALKKWCPHARVMVSEDLGGKDTEEWVSVAVNRTPMREDKVVNARCIASDCMAWRGVDRPGSTDPVGFCGAFGKPAGA